jgi:hypothetical protein
MTSTNLLRSCHIDRPRGFFFVFAQSQPRRLGQDRIRMSAWVREVAQAMTRGWLRRSYMTLWLADLRRLAGATPTPLHATVTRLACQLSTRGYCPAIHCSTSAYKDCKNVFLVIDSHCCGMQAIFAEHPIVKTWRLMVESESREMTCAR